MNLFSSEFLVFLLLIFGIYYIVPKKFQWIVLLTGSMIFYVFSGMENFIYIVVTSLTTWYFGIYMDKLKMDMDSQKKKEGITREEKKKIKEVWVSKKRKILFLTLVINFGILAYLKYWETIYNSFLQIQNKGEVSLGILLPLGISFYTFQSVGYVLDQYHGVYKEERNYFKYLLFISFFPQMIQGPIGRFAQLGYQLLEDHTFCKEDIKEGLFLILFGTMKKYTIANILSEPISIILDGSLKDSSGALIITAILMYSAQLYSDFSGGIDIVTGIAKLFGISLASNFKQPYFSVSLADFWRRWHISLGSWMRDYVFYPFVLTKTMQKFGKNCTKLWGKEIGRVIPACIGNILVFFIVGIWHGANMHFIVWGLYNGIIISISEIMTPFFDKVKEKYKINDRTKLYNIFVIVRTFIIVNIGWYFDRITSMRECFYAFKNTILNLQISSMGEDLQMILEGVLTKKEGFLVLVAIGIVFLHSYLAECKQGMFYYLNRSNRIIRWGFYYLLLIIIQFSMSYATKTEMFMYAVF